MAIRSTASRVVRQLVERQDLVVMALPLVAFGALMAYGSDYITSIGVTVGTYAVLGLGLNVVIGYAGLVDLGYAAFFAIGAYATAILTTKFNWNPWATLPAAVAAAAIAGAILGYPTLRLRSDYLAIVTLGFGEMVRLSFNNWSYVNGPDGIYGIPIPTLFGQQLITQSWDMAMVTVLLMGALFVTRNISQSALTRGWMALRQDELAAEVVGIPTLKLKMWAYIIGGMLGGLAGAIFALRIGLVNPGSFTLSVTITVLILLVLGGRGSQGGVLLGAVVVVGLPELLRNVQQFRLLAFAVALVAIIILRPKGLWPQPIRHPSLTDTRYPDASNRSRGEVPTDRPLLQVKGLTQAFGGLLALRDVSLDVWPKEILSIIGPNGAGKTTVFNCLNRLQSPRSGEITFAGRRVRRQRPHDVAALGMARTFQGIRLFPEMTVLENVMVGLAARRRTRILGAMLHLPDERKEEKETIGESAHWLRFVAVDKLARRRAAELSYADQRRVEIARALASRPRLLLLDEPAAGMNPTEKAELVRLVRRIRDLGIAVVLIDHDMAVVMNVSDRVIVMDLGQVIAVGSPAAVQNDPKVIGAYLGSGDEIADRMDQNSEVDGPSA
jgi:branched-chain amino acid transport system permease protein